MSWKKVLFDHPRCHHMHHVRWNAWMSKLILMHVKEWRQLTYFQHLNLLMNFDKLKRARSYGIQLDETTEISNKLRLIVHCGFADEEIKTIVKPYLCCLKVGVSQLLKRSSTFSINSLRNMVWIWRSVSQLLPMNWSNSHARF